MRTVLLQQEKWLAKVKERKSKKKLKTHKPKTNKREKNLPIEYCVSTGVVVFQQGDSLLSFVFESCRKFRFFEPIGLWVLTENEWVEKFGFSFSWVL
jgi:hypothetical protein